MWLFYFLFFFLIFVVFHFYCIYYNVIILIAGLQVAAVSNRVRTKSASPLAVSIAFWPIFLAVARFAVDFRFVRCDRVAVQSFLAGHCAKQTETLAMYVQIQRLTSSEGRIFRQ